MISDNFGCMQISKFGPEPHVELLNAIAHSVTRTAKGLIIDLQGNTGGYMEAAIRMVNEFLPEGRLIVYTQGVNIHNRQYANGTGRQLPEKCLL